MKKPIYTIMFCAAAFVFLPLQSAQADGDLHHRVTPLSGVDDSHDHVNDAESAKKEAELMSRSIEAYKPVQANNGTGPQVLVDGGETGPRPLLRYDGDNDLFNKVKMPERVFNNIRN